MALCARIFNAKLRTRIVKVGRAVHCAPGLAMQARLPGLNLVFPRPYERGYGVRLSGAQKTRGQDGRAPNLPKGARASTPAETTPRLTLLHHLISQLRNCPTRNKPLPCSARLDGTAARMAARQSTPAPDRPGRRRPAAKMAARLTAQ